MTIKTRWLMAVSAAMLLSCQTAVPPTYYRLDATASLGTVGPGPSIGLAPVEVPEYLARSSIIRDFENLQVDVSTTERWAEPLDSGIARTVTLNLTRALPTDDVRPYPWNSKQAPDIAIRIRISELHSFPSQATLVAETILTARNGEFSSQLISLQAPLARSANGRQIATAYSQLIAELSEQIAGNIRSLIDVKLDQAS